MADFKLSWDDTGERLYETGLDHGVLYPYHATAQNDTNYYDGVEWNGLTTVTQSPSGAESNPIYADNMKYLDLRSAEEFGATIEAYTYPDEFAECDGSVNIAQGVTASQQARKKFGFSYRTKIGSDDLGDSKGYKIHLVYGATASPSEKGYQTVNDSPEAVTFSWEISTEPVTVKNTSFRPVAHLEIDSTKADGTKLAQLEQILYGTAATTGDNPTEAVPARMPMPAEIITLMGSANG